MKTAKEAVRYMYELRRDGATGLAGWCLRTCRKAWGLPADQPSAIKEWESIPDHAKSRKWWLAPLGAPHFWETPSGFGHVALQSRVPGRVWSTDAPFADRVGVVRLSFFRKRWGARYLGWSKQLNNHSLPLSRFVK